MPYTYTADGDRLVRREGNTTTIYLPGGGEIARTGSTTSAIRYYTFNGEVVASRTGRGSANVMSLVGNSQHTPQLAVNNATNTPVRRHHDPYGNPRDKTPVTWMGDHGFLDKPTDSTGLTHIGARYYDPGIGQFVSPDPLLHTEVPQQFHPYNYANANPSTLTDPTGLSPLLGSAFSFLSMVPVISAVVRVVYHAYTVVRSWVQATSASSRSAASSWGGSSYGRSSYTASRTYSSYRSPNAYAPYSRAAVGITHQPTISMEALHRWLDGWGFTPGWGEAADGVNAVLYAAQGDWGNAVISAAAMVPLFGSLGTGARVAKNTAREAKEISQAIANKTAKATDSRIVYRGLAKNENPTTGLVARAPGNNGIPPISHVAGKVQSPWISTSKSAEVASSKYGQHGVVAIDLNKVSSEVVDVSGGFPNGGRMSNWAKNDQEVLIRGSVPPPRSDYKVSAVSTLQEIVEKLDLEYDRSEGFLGLLRSGTFDPKGEKRLLKLLASLKLSDGPMDRSLVRHLWFLPVFLQWQKERFEYDKRNVDAVDSTLTEVVNILIDVVGVP